MVEIFDDQGGYLLAIQGSNDFSEWTNQLPRLSIVQVMFPEGNAIFQDDTAPIHSARIVMEWHDENSNEDDQLVKPKKSPDLNIIENSWSV